MNNNGSDCEENNVYKTTKKKKSHGRMSEVLKKLKLSSHEPGPACGCKLGCFIKIPAEARNQILQNFNLLASHDAQNSYLCGLISVLIFNSFCLEGCIQTSCQFLLKNIVTFRT
ncbi:hypothetical protein PYW08_010399 [Mythimna loreyi]|uniref:Uncharacterized protein n=1 Tax=Mythimna loreyi TaxID=667449 RepID=A0ACC2Q4P0_9NEOP|nr:hypothetical protein PYW08_010399 [Mythimna loreyi]